MSPNDRQLNLPKREEKILEFWERNKIFEKTLAKTKGKKPFIFYEGPPTANGSPGIHHFEARAFKDVIPRYKTMRGYYVERKAGWDTHGLPVEIQVEKELGFKSKREIEKFGIGKFNAKAKESVWNYKAEWDRFTKRIGFWLDLEHPYITYETSYIETLWWIIKEIWKKKLLYRDFKVVPWCPRCETALSTHELGLGYETVKDRSVYVRFRVISNEKRWANTAILSWTTTPWTLPGNVALAVKPDAEYVVIPDPDAKGRWLILGKEPWRNLVEKSLFPPEYRSQLMLDDIETIKGQELVGLSYEPLFAVKELVSPKSHRVYAADFVTMEEGTGVVHTAVMYGEDDYRLGKKEGLPAFHTVDESGRFIQELGEGLGGKFVKAKETEEAIVASLKRRGLLFKEEQYEHEYPFCWRCSTPILYYARNAWWVKMSAKRKELIANNEKINWVPEHLQHGRFGEFLREVRDWAFSRERYWGTPLPVWQCGKCAHEEVIGSLDELAGFKPAKNRYWAMRHGESETLLLGIVSSSSKYHLTDKGRKGAARAAEKLKKSGINLIVTSPIGRAKETADIVKRALGVPVKVSPRLREIEFGILEGGADTEYVNFFANELEQFEKSPKGGESLNEVRKRMASLLKELERDYAGKKILLVSHADPIWVLWGTAQGLTPQGMITAHPGWGEFLAPAAVVEIPLRVLPRDEIGAVNLHRPFVDDFRFVCPKCRGEMRRVPEVADVWFDSGAMPFAQAHFPFAFGKGKGAGGRGQGAGTLAYPADYICEAIDQTRGWFYTLLAVATALGRGAPYRNVISLGHVLDKNGQKMSKSKGNVVEPFPMIEKYGADTIRWYFYTINAPGDPKRFDERDLLLKLRGPLATLWNSFVFFDTYADKARNPKPETRSKSQIPSSQHVLDRWALAKLCELIADVTKRLDGYDIVGAARRLEAFIMDDFSNWYLRRSRRRFQKPENQKEKEEAAGTAACILETLARLLAPFVPFVTEAIWLGLQKKMPLKEPSVHLAEWPETLRLSAKAKELLDQMKFVREIAAAALAERAKAGIKVRQPLASFSAPGSYALQTRSPWKTSAWADRHHASQWGELLNLAAEEANVKEITFSGGAFKLDTTITSELREEGIIREIIRNIQEMRRDGGMQPRDAIRLQISGDRALEAVISRWEAFLEREVGATAVEVGGKKSFSVARDVDLDGVKLWIGIRNA